MKILSFFISFVLATNLIAYDAINPHFAKFQRSPQIDEETWESLIPYLIPETHPAKVALDKILRHFPDILSSKKALREADFEILKHPQNKMIIARHPLLKGYLIKAYLDDVQTKEWIWWKKRINGANAVRESIQAHGYDSLMKVPRKWMYALPPAPAPQLNPNKKCLILVVEDMRILPNEKNRKAYRKKLTKTHLDALYTIIMENSMIDSIYIDNIPLSKDGKIAFVDTEYVHDRTRPVRIWHIAHYFSKEMHAYWEQLVQNGVPVRSGL